VITGNAHFSHWLMTARESKFSSLLSSYVRLSFIYYNYLLNSFFFFYYYYFDFSILAPLLVSFDHLCRSVSLAEEDAESIKKFFYSDWGLKEQELTLTPDK